MNKQELCRLIWEKFDEGELSSLCKALGIDYEDLPGKTRKVKAEELVFFCDRHDRLIDLHDYLKKERPTYNWDDFFDINQPDHQKITDSGGSDDLPPILYHRFIDRAALSEVVSRLEGQKSTILISGMGGAGKTSLVRAIVELIREKNDRVPHFNFIVWIDVNDENTTLDTIFNAVARRHGYPGLTQESISDEKAQKIKGLLTDNRTLIVVDNFEKIRDEKVIHWFSSNNFPPFCKAILISRQQYGYIRGITPYILDLMKPHEARKFIEQQCWLLIVELTESQSFKLIEATEGNPLVIEFTLGLYRIGNESFNELVANLYTSKEEGLFNMLFSRAWESLDDNAKNLFMLTTFFPNSISRKALSEVANDLGIDFEKSLKELLDLILIKPILQFRDDKEDRSNLVSDSKYPGHEENPDEMRYNLHPLCRSFASEKLSHRPVFAQESRRRWLEWVISYLSDKKWTWQDLRKLDAVKREEPVAYAAIIWAADHDLHQEAIEIAKGLDHYYYVRGHWDKKAEIDRLRIHAANALKDYNEEAISISQYAQMLSTRAKQEDLEQVQTKLLSRLAEIEGMQQLPPNTIAAMRHAQAFYHIARKEYPKALDILSDFQNHAELTTANYSIANQHWLAYCYLKCKDLRMAEANFEKALEEAEENNYLRSVSFCKRNLAEIAIEKEDYDRAARLIEDAYKRASEFNDRRYLAQCELVYARLLINQGKYGSAKEFFETAEDRYARLNLFTEMEERQAIRADLERLKMTITWNEFDVIDFQQRVENSAQSALMLDYDGTLAPFRDAKERNLAFPYPGVRELLSKIMGEGKTRVVIISARPVNEILPLVGLEPAPEIWGIYGWERRLPDGSYFGPSTQDPKSVAALQEAVEWAKKNKLEWEAKPDIQNPVSVALHWRVDSDDLKRSRDDLQKMIEVFTDELVGESNLLVKGGDHVRELMIPGIDKGVAVKAILSELESPGVAAYLGDSPGDEDAFEAVSSVGLAVLVNSEDRPTAATLRVSPPGELLEFLKCWISS